MKKHYISPNLNTTHLGPNAICIAPSSSPLPPDEPVGSKKFESFFDEENDKMWKSWE